MSKKTQIKSIKSSSKKTTTSKAPSKKSTTKKVVKECNVVVEPLKKVEATVTSTSVSPTTEKKTSLSKFIQSLILSTEKTNTEIYEECVKAGYNMDNKKHYPSWYRAYIRRNCEVKPQQ